MKKSLLSLTLLIGLSGVPSLAAVGWKRAWQCRNLGGQFEWNQTRKERERLTRNKCTDVEVRAGNSLWEFIVLQAGPSVAIFGTIAAVAGLAKKWEKKEEERKKGKGAAEESLLYQVAE